MHWLILYLIGLVIALKIARREYKKMRKDGDVLDPEAVYFYAIFWPAGILVFAGLWFLSGEPFRLIAELLSS